MFLNPSFVPLPAQYKKFNTHSDAQEYLGDKVKIQKTVQTKSVKSKPKRFDNIPSNLIKQEISDPPPETPFSSYEKLTIQNPNKDTAPSESKGGLHVVYSDGCCFGNGQVGSRAGYGVYWDDGHPWYVRWQLRQPASGFSFILGIPVNDCEAIRRINELN